MIEKIRNKFEELFGGGGDIRAYFAPGRVNLIGEHTDYNGGHVFPYALSMGNYAVARVRDDKKIRWFNMTYPENGVQEREIDGLMPNDNGLWYDYQLGVIWAFQQNGYKVTRGYDMVMAADMPAGAGLSASASIEELAAVILKDLLSIDISMVDCALMGQYSENKYNGMNCGIMDQFASAMGKKDHAIFLNTDRLEYSYVPLNLKAEKIVITNSLVKHSLAGSAYNERRRQCEEALSDLQKNLDIKTLGDLDEEAFEEHKALIKDPVCLKRARHAVYENQRAIAAVEELKSGNIEEFGRLMKESHVSLRDDYEVSCRELDILAEEAWKLPGVIGSRMTGGGFGGCTVSIVEDREVEAFKEKLSHAYSEKTGLTPEFYIADAADGARRLELQMSPQ
ncbi:MAG: galactokinase [Lachnospiraceae bacterium]|nr:galactokinase [Lachnospiraceae bacterium]